VTIDGGNGEVFAGEIAGETTIVPEAQILLSWADASGIEIAGTVRKEQDMSDKDEHQNDAVSAGQATRGAMVRLLSVKGFATPDAAAAALRTSEDDATHILDRMTADGLVKMMGPMFSLSDDGKTVADELLAKDREAWGADRASAGLDSFIPLDGRMKVIVTAWQMCEVDGAPVLNDHTDAEYDAAVLADLSALHVDANAWLATLTGELPRLGAYVARLGRAASLVDKGDHEYIASPRLDSYHNVWFELHEDLILLAGLTREDEVASGRA
jgi:pyruvate,orthophosphate dikinase